MTDDQNEPEPLSPARGAGDPRPARRAARPGDPGRHRGPHRRRPRRRRPPRPCADRAPPGEGEPATRRRPHRAGRRRAWLHSRVLQSAAALVVVAVVGVAAVGVLGSPEDAKSPTTASSGAAAEQTPGPITRSDQRYSAANLDQLRARPAPAGHRRGSVDRRRHAGPERRTRAVTHPTSTTGTADLPAAPRPRAPHRRAAHGHDRPDDPPALRRPARRGARRVQPLAVDVGRWKGKPAALILLPDAPTRRWSTRGWSARPAATPTTRSRTSYAARHPALSPPRAARLRPRRSRGMPAPRLSFLRHQPPTP